MKKTLYILSLALIVLFACSPDNVDNTTEIPGQIPGMGDASGELQISEKFVLPEGVTLVSIKGIDNPSPTEDIRAINLKSTNEGDDGHEDGDDCEGGHDDDGGDDGHDDGGDEGHEDGGNCEGGHDDGSDCDDSSQQELGIIPVFGSGGEWIALEMIFENATSTNKDIVIPGGCLFEAQEDGYQHGILVQDVRIKVLGNKKIQIKLYLYCINKGKHGSEKQVTYVIKGVTQSEWMDKLTEALKYKDIDISNFDEDQLAEYELISDAIQEIVWGITNGRGVNEKDWTFIEELRDIIAASEGDE